MSRLRVPMRVSCAAVLVVVSAVSASAAPAAPAREHRAEWLRRARWGVMVHYLADWIWGQEALAKGLSREEGMKLRTVEGWNALIDGFDVEGLASQLQELRAGYFLLSIGQNSGYFLAPNPTYDGIVGVKPSKCSRRDLVSDLGDALAKRGIRLMVYLPAGAPAGDDVAGKALEWKNGPHRNREFQQKWEAVIRDWSTRWGKKVSGWWFDGCYWPNHMYRGEAPNFETFAAAARAGNPDSAVAFNPGVFYPVWPMSDEQDYIAGEVADPTRDIVRDGRMDRSDGRYDGKADGVQLHVLSFLGETWGRAGQRGRRDPFGEARFTGLQIVDITMKVLAYGGAFTWDVPVERNGRIPREFMTRLRQLGDTLETMAVTFGAEPRARPQ